MLTVHELADTLETELSILQTSGPGGEQELVDAMVGWSYQRLSRTEKLIFERLSVFGGSFGREAVAEVCGDGLGEVEVVDVLSSLGRPSRWSHAGTTAARRPASGCCN